MDELKPRDKVSHTFNVYEVKKIVQKAVPEQARNLKDESKLKLIEQRFGKT